MKLYFVSRNGDVICVWVFHFLWPKQIPLSLLERLETSRNPISVPLGTIHGANLEIFQHHHFPVKILNKRFQLNETNRHLEKKIFCWIIPGSKSFRIASLKLFSKCWAKVNPKNQLNLFQRKVYFWETTKYTSPFIMSDVTFDMFEFLLENSGPNVKP